MKITLCGAGNAAHTLAALLAGHPEHRVVIYAPLGDEAQRLRAASAGGLRATFADGRQRVGTPHQVTADAAEAVHDTDMVLLALPSFAHGDVLAAIAPFLPRRAAVGALPARGGFDWLARALLPEHEGLLFGVQTLPWACRIHEWGRHVHVLGVKAQVDLAATPAHKAAATAQELGALLELPLRPVDGFLTLTLANPGQLIHPGIMYGQYHDWDGRPMPLEAVPLFYGEVSSRTADVVQALSDEVQGLCRVLEERLPGLDLRAVAPIFAWLLAAYPGQIDDTHTLQSALNSNRAYAGIRFPTEAAEGGGVTPAFRVRYLTEDVPYGLLVTRGIAELADYPTPMISRVIEWSQERIGRDFLAGGRVAGEDVASSRAPQRFGIGALHELIQAPLAA
jgi:hypothetical protein